jgi:hypothetical protein
MNKALYDFYNNVDPVDVYPESKDYIKKYWLDEEEYVSHWEPLQDKIFDDKVGFLHSGRIFLPEFKLMALKGGATFNKKDFILLQECMRELGEKYFVVIENCATSPEVYKKFKNKKNGLPGKPLKFKYPVNIKWNEIYTGDFLSDAMIGVWQVREFYIFGESGLWGKYAANDYCSVDVNPLGPPLNILGFKDECVSLFRGTFGNCMTSSEKEMARVSLSSLFLHPAYKEYTEHLQIR